MGVNAAPKELPVSSSPRPIAPRQGRAVRLALAAAGLLAFVGLSGVAHASTILPNTGSLGSIANGTAANAVTFGPGAVTAGNDQSAVYNNVGGTETTIPYLTQLNPDVSSPFTVEFWANPTASDNDDAPVGNRVATTLNRSGWVFFQRAAASGWNFRMYNGSGSSTGVDITGGTATLNAWSHVVATWNGSTATLYVNGALAAAASPGPGGYSPNSANPDANSLNAHFIIGEDDTASPVSGSVDEVAWYPSALTATQVLAHFNAISSTTPGFYQQLVRTDGAALQITSNVPEPTTALLLSGAAGALLLRRRRRRT
jgi:hypothetical protein